MLKLEYVFEHENIIHVIQYKPSTNKKIGLGYIIQTYHFSKQQIDKVDLTLDSLNCLDCPMSFRKDNNCYTHKGNQRMGLMAMLKSKSKLDIKPFCNKEFTKFLSKFPSPQLTRFGAYGEPVLLPEIVVNKLIAKSKGNYTAYTHQWRSGDYQWAMASVHSLKQMIEAESRGYRVFWTVPKNKQADTKKLINCPASKESKYNKTCLTCGLCNGANENKSIYIRQH